MKRVLGGLALGLALGSGCTDTGELGETKPLARRGDRLAPGQAELVKDLLPPSASTSSEGSAPRNSVLAGHTLFFTAEDALHGRELWASDGSSAGTRLVLDLMAGPDGSAPEMLTPVGSAVFFVANDGTGARLWKSDGTPEGTAAVPLEPSLTLEISELKAVGGTLFLSASDGVRGRELWKSDGTAAGTGLVTDLRPGSDSSFPTHFTPVGTTLYFTAESLKNGRELWKTDGTAAGTGLVQSFPFKRGKSLLSPSSFKAVGSTLYAFWEWEGEQQTELWKSDGTSAGTVLLKAFQRFRFYSPWSLPGMADLGGVLFFTANDGQTGTELWKSDGTAAGTVLVKDLTPQGSSEPSHLTVMGSQLFFTTSGGYGGIWRSDGTEAGTRQVSYLQSPGNFGVAGSRLYVFQNSPYGGWLSVYDPAWDWVTMLHSFSGPPADNGPVQPITSEFVSDGDTLFFVANGDGWGSEPWKTTGTPESTVLLADVRAPVGGAPQSLVDVGGKVLFQANGAKGSTGLWASDGTPGGTMLLQDETRLLPGSQTLNGVTYLSAATASSGAELWRSDGTGPGTWQVRELEPGNRASTPRSFAALPGKLLFVATTSEWGSELWTSDGTGTGTQLLKDITPAWAQDQAPEHLRRVGNTVYFSANDGLTGTELWKTDGTPAGTVLAADLVPGKEGSSPQELQELNGTLVFLATEPKGPRVPWRLEASGTVSPVGFGGMSSQDSSGLTVVGQKAFFFTSADTNLPALWMFDGTSSSATLVASKRFNAPIRSAAVGVGQVLYFVASDAEHGYELWRSDGTSEGTRMVKDVLPGPRSGALRSPLLGLGAQGQVLFRATEGVFGVEPWVSDGTAAGTRRVGDLAPGARSSDPREFTLSGGAVLFSADDGTRGAELWRYTPSNEAPPDTTPPMLTCPASMRVEAVSSFGAQAVWSPARAVDDVTAVPEVTYSRASGSWFPLGRTQVGVSARDAAGNTASCSFEVWVRDTTAPSLTCPANLVEEATGSEGAFVRFPPANVSDAVTGQPWFSYSRSGDFPLGTTRVEMRAGDEAGNTSTCSFTVTVRDSIPPVVECPDIVGAEATAPTGATVMYSLRRVYDRVSPVALTYSRASGSEFPLGTTTVVVTGRDAAGNTSTCSFPVIVGDHQRPRIVCPANQELEATGPYPQSAVATYAGSATDAVTPQPLLAYTPPSGSTFPLGFTQVRMTATDEAGLEAACFFSVYVRDTTAPALVCPAAVIAEATSASGASVTYAAAQASDISGMLTVEYSQASGSTFALGQTRVTVTARDGSSNSSTCTFPVTVRDTTAPTVTCPAALSVEATSASGASVTYAAAQAVDGVSAVTLSYSQASGSTFALGTTQVEVKATDAAGNTGMCSFAVTVQDTTAPTVTCPAALSVEATSASGASVTYAAAQAVDGVSAVTLSYSQASGSTFALGTTQVEVKATDAAGNTGTCSFPVTVGDTTAPVLTCPAALVLEATGPEGATGSYTATAQDAVSASTLSYSQASGSTFVLGTTQVEVKATDAAGNAATCSFPVTVRDTTAPTVTCPAAMSVEATSASGASVTYAAAQGTDSVSAVTLTYSQASGTTFALGTTQVEVRATDAAGNSATCRFPVAVGDTTAPVLTCPAALVLEAIGPEGAMGNYTATAQDAVSASTLTYSHASGSLFALGTTQVEVKATDVADNAATCTFPVTVRDTTAPTVTCPAALTVEATSASGASVTYAAAEGTDSVSAVTLGYSQASGTTFALGTTQVETKATDAAGNAATCTLAVTVRDTTAPVLTCPVDVELEAEAESGRAVDYAAAQVLDVVTASPAVTYSRPSGSEFPVGTTSVDVTARDAAGNKAACSFRVTVKSKPSLGSGSGSGGGCAATGGFPLSVWGTWAVLSWVLRRRSSPRRS